MSRYTVYVVPRAWSEIRALLGHVRQRVRQVVDDLAENPRPPGSKRLTVLDLQPELYRLRLDRWRVMYAVTEEGAAVDVMAVRKRPPYDYGDLELIAGIP